MRSNMGTEYTQENIDWDQQIPSPLPVTLTLAAAEQTGRVGATAMIELVIADQPSDPRIAAIDLSLGLHGVSTSDVIALEINPNSDNDGAAFIELPANVHNELRRVSKSDDGDDSVVDPSEVGGLPLTIIPEPL